MKKVYLLFITIFFAAAVFANYSTPGTGVRWTLTNLVANSAGAVTMPTEGNYQVNDTVFIRQNDTLSITANAVVAFTSGTYFDINGVIIVNPPTNVTFTAVNTSSGYLGMRIDSSNGSLLRKLTFEYAVSLRLSDCSPTIDSCIFRYNNNSTVTTFGTSTITLFRSSPLITNCQFLNNQRAAISGGSNIANAPKIISCLFQGNNTQNVNVPQINLGASGTDTVRIINNQILRASTSSGGIGFLPTGDVRVVISGNLIKNNRYGIVLQGGSNINALVSYNQIDSNNTENNPNVGGSGISFPGGTATSQQNSIVTGNLIRWNLWGITIQNRAKPNLGNITNTDTTDDGKNQIYGNTNAGTPNIDLYNNTVDSIYAQNNYWGSGDPVVVESHIFHKTDNSALGLVIYQPFLTSPLPVKLLSFSALQVSRDVLLNWQTTSEINAAYFNVERSEDGRNFNVIGSVNITGNSNAVKKYDFTDANVNVASKMVYYRLKMVDKDGASVYSQMILVKLLIDAEKSIVNVFPTLLNGSQTVQASINSTTEELVNILWYDAKGSLLSESRVTVYAGKNTIMLTPPVDLPKGRLFVQFKSPSFIQTVSVIKQ